MRKPRVAIGWVLAVMLIVLSANTFASKGELTAEAWGFLLLTPLALAMALTPTAPWENGEPEDSESWDEEDETDAAPKDVPDPVEAGFDVPVL